MTIEPGDKKETKGKKIKYIAVEMLMKDADITSKMTSIQKDSIESGLLNGIQTKEGPGKDEEESFILLLCAGDIVKACNLSVYNVLTFEVYDGVEREITFFRACEEDQTAAISIINGAMELLKEAKRMTENNGIVDVNTYSDLPDDFDNKSGTKSPITSTTSIKSASHKGTGTTTTGVGTTTAYTTREKEPFPFKRNTKKPTKTALKKMEAAVKAITDGTYNAPTFPVIEKDDDPNDDKEDDSTTDTKTNMATSITGCDTHNWHNFEYGMPC